MFELQLHGTSLLRNVPVNKLQIKWGKETNTWKSVFELANSDIDIMPTNEIGDYLVLDLSYTINCEVVVKGKQIYSVNNANRNSGLLDGTEKAINIKEVGLERVKTYFDNYISKVKKAYDSKNIILVKMVCPDRCISNSLVKPYTTIGKDEFNNKIREFEDYFIEKVDPIVVDISRYYYHDLDNRKYGPFVSYEQGYFENVKEVLEDIILRKREGIHNRPSYSYILRRYVDCYDVAYERNEQYLLLERDTPLNIIIRAMNKEMVNRYKYALAAIYSRNLVTFDQMLEQYDFQFFPKLKEFILIVRNVTEDRYDLIGTEIYDYFGFKYGLELDIMTKTRKYYYENGYIHKTMINITNAREFYMAMKYEQYGEYLKAIEYVNLAIKLFDKKLRKYHAKNNEVGEFRESVAYYSNSCSPVLIDIWGINATNKVIYRRDGKYRVTNTINTISCIETERYNEVFSALNASEAHWIIFDVYSLLWQKNQIENRTEEDIKQKIATFMDELSVRYGDNIIFHKYDIKTEYRDKDNQIARFISEEALRKNGAILNKWQQYISDKYNCKTIDIAAETEIDSSSFVITYGINYQEQYFIKANDCINQITRQQEIIKLEDNFINAYINMNLGDDLFIEMLLDRYPNTQFSILAKNKSVTKAFDKYKNLKIVLSNNPQIGKCKSYISIGGSIFPQENIWYTKYSKRVWLLKKIKKNYVLGSNFGPCVTEEFLQLYKGLFEKYDDICFRDKASFELFSENENVRLAPDIVFSYDLDIKVGDSKKVVISVIDLSYRDKLSEHVDRYNNNIAKLCAEFVQRGMQVCLMSFCDNEKDGEAINTIIGLLDDKTIRNVDRYSYNGNIKEAINVICDAEYMVGTRFHANILGMLCQRTVYPIIYSIKTSNMLRDIGFEGNSCNIEEIERLTADKVLENSKCKIDCSDVAKLAETQFAGLDRQFKKG